MTRQRTRDLRLRTRDTARELRTRDTRAGILDTRNVT